jgi:hypothetical protein
MKELIGYLHVPAQRDYAGSVTTGQRRRTMPRESFGTAQPATFVCWGERFFDYFQQYKAATNPKLMELIFCLGDGGRNELLLSIFNFLRPQLWKQFCCDRQGAKKQASSLLLKVVVDLRRARRAYKKLLSVDPDPCSGRILAGNARLHFSDILEEEARFLCVQSKLITIACRAKRRNTCESGKTWISTQGEICKESLRASRKLDRAGESYRELLTFHPRATIGRVFYVIHPHHFPEILDEVMTEVGAVRDRVPLAFKKKRAGAKHNLTILVRLQFFIEEFARRLDGYLPQVAATSLSESDLADLLEAGKSASGLRQKLTMTNPESIGRALERFRAHQGNARLCQALRADAHQVFDNLSLQSSH